MAGVVDVLTFIITGDNRGLKQAATEADKLVTSMAGGISKGLASLAVRFAGLTGGAILFAAALRNTLGQSIQSERIFRQLGAAIDGAGGSWKNLESRIREAAKEMQKFSVFTDEQFAEAMKVLVQSGMDANQALSLMQVAADAASATGVNLAEVANILGLAFQGSVRGARALGIVLDDTGDKSKNLAKLVDEMQSRFRGRAITELETTAGAWAKLGNQFKEAGENIGNFLLPPLQKLLEVLNKLFELATSTEANADFWARLFGRETNEEKLARIRAAGIEKIKAEVAELERLGRKKEAALKRLAFPEVFAPPLQPTKAGPIVTSSPETERRAMLERLAIRRKGLEELSKLEDENVARMVEAQTEGLQAIMQAEQERFEFRRQMGEDTAEEEIAFLEKIKSTAERLGIWEEAAKAAKEIEKINNQTALKAANVWRKSFFLILDGLHRLASVFGRFMGEAIENFVHTALDAIGEIKTAIASIPKGGALGFGGALGIAGAAFGVIGSIVDMFSSGAEKIYRSNLEVVRGIRDWISNLRGATKAELGATESDITKALGIVRATLGTYFESVGIAAAQRLEGYKAIQDLFNQTHSWIGRADEVLAFWLQLIKEQGSTFNIIAAGLKSVEDVKEFLKKQTQLDYQTGRQFIEFFSNQNKFTPAQQKELYESLLAALQTSGNLTVSELISLTEIIKELAAGTSAISEQGEQQIQITRSVASITENQANLVVSLLQTIAAATQRILEVIELAISNAAAAAGVGGGVNFAAGAIVINSSAQSGYQLAAEFQLALRAKGVKV